MNRFSLRSLAHATLVFFLIAQSPRISADATTQPLPWAPGGTTQPATPTTQTDYISQIAQSQANQEFQAKMQDTANQLQSCLDATKVNGTLGTQMDLSSLDFTKNLMNQISNIDTSSADLNKPCPGEGEGSIAACFPPENCFADYQTDKTSGLDCKSLPTKPDLTKISDQYTKSKNAIQCRLKQAALAQKQLLCINNATNDLTAKTKDLQKYFEGLVQTAKTEAKAVNDKVTERMSQDKQMGDLLDPTNGLPAAQVALQGAISSLDAPQGASKDGPSILDISKTVENNRLTKIQIDNAVARRKLNLAMQCFQTDLNGGQCVKGGPLVSAKAKVICAMNDLSTKDSSGAQINNQAMKDTSASNAKNLSDKLDEVFKNIAEADVIPTDAATAASIAKNTAKIKGPEDLGPGSSFYVSISAMPNGKRLAQYIYAQFNRCYQAKKQEVDDQVNLQTSAEGDLRNLYQKWIDSNDNLNAAIKARVDAIGNLYSDAYQKLSKVYVPFKNMGNFPSSCASGVALNGVDCMTKMRANLYGLLNGDISSLGKGSAPTGRTADFLGRTYPDKLDSDETPVVCNNGIKGCIDELSKARTTVQAKQKTLEVKRDGIIDRSNTTMQVMISQASKQLAPVTTSLKNILGVIKNKITSLGGSTMPNFKTIDASGAELKDDTSFSMAPNTDKKISKAPAADDLTKMIGGPAGLPDLSVDGADDGTKGTKEAIDAQNKNMMNLSQYVANARNLAKAIDKSKADCAKKDLAGDLTAANTALTSAQTANCQFSSAVCEKATKDNPTIISSVKSILDKLGSSNFDDADALSTLTTGVNGFCGKYAANKEKWDNNQKCINGDKPADLKGEDNPVNRKTYCDGKYPGATDPTSTTSTCDAVSTLKTKVIQMRGDANKVKDGTTDSGTTDK